MAFAPDRPWLAPACALAAVVGLGPPAGAQTGVAPGVTLYDDDGAHVVVVELDHPEVTFEVSEPELRGSTVSEYAAARSAVVALNGGPFALASFAPEGLTIGAGRPWAGSGDDGAHALLAVDIDGCGGIYQAEPWIARERWMYAAVPGTAIVTAQGVGTEPAACGGEPCRTGAQSAVGLSSDGRRMVLVAADAATAPEVGDLLAAHGAWVGMLLDGGSSTAMVVGGSVVNQLSDGVERRVASHLGIFSGRPPRSWDVRGIVTGEPTVDVEIRTFWDSRLDGRRTVPISGTGPDGLFQFMPVPFRNIRIATADRCAYTGFSGPEDVRLWWSVDPGATCPPAECARVAEAWAVDEPTCDEPPAREAAEASALPLPLGGGETGLPFALAMLGLWRLFGARFGRRP